MFSSHPRIRKRNFRVSVNDSINCSDHCFRSHNKDGACMETFPHILATEWLLAISISTSLHPLCQDWTWSSPLPGMLSGCHSRWPQATNTLLTFSTSIQDINVVLWIVGPRKTSAGTFKGSLNTFITWPASRQVDVSESPSLQYLPSVKTLTAVHSPSELLTRLEPASALAPPSTNMFLSALCCQQLKP